MVYKLHKQGISNEHPRFGLRKPMRVAAAHGRLEMLKWLSEQEERDEWLQDPWLLDEAIKSCDLDVAQWVHRSHTGEEASHVMSRSLHTVASAGAIEILHWALATFPDTQLTTEAMDGAAANGHLETGQYLHAEREEGCTTAAMDKAAGNGHLMVVEYLHTHRQEGCTLRAMNDAAGNGHLVVIKFLDENRDEGCTNKAVKEATAGGHLDVLRFLHESRSEEFTEEAMDWAIRKGHLDVAKYLLEQECGSDGDYLYSVAVALMERHLSLVRFACEHFHANLSAAVLKHGESDDILEKIEVFEHFNVDGWTTEVMDHAAEVGSLEAVEYLHYNRMEGCTTKAMDNAASQGHLEVVKFLHEHRSEGCTKRAMNGATEKGALDVVKYLHEHRTEGFTGITIEGAARNGHIDVMRFLLDHCDLSIPSKAVSRAARMGHWELMKMLFRRQFPQDFSLILCELACCGHLELFKRILHLGKAEKPTLRKCLAGAVGKGHWYLAKFLLGEARYTDPSGYSDDNYCFYNIFQAASLYGDVDMVDLLLSTKVRFTPRQAHGFINTTILGNLELLELLENARIKQNHFWDEEPSDKMDNEFFEDTKFQWRFVQIAVAAVHGHLEIL